MIRLYTRNKALVKLINEAIAGQSTGGIKHEEPTFVDRPRSAHYMITKSALNRDAEWFAAQLGAYPVVLPDAMPWLLERIANEHSLGIETKIVGSDYMRPNRNGE